MTENSQITGDASNGTVTYAYDPLGRLTGSTLAGTTTAYGWDPPWPASFQFPSLTCVRSVL